MSIATLISEARSDILGDDVAEYLWSDVQLTRYALEAVKEACMRAPLIVKGYTIPIIAATYEYTTSLYLRQIYMAKLNLQAKPLQQETEAGLTSMYGHNWRDHTGTPTHYVRTGHKIRLYPIPIANDTLAISGSSIPDGTFDIDVDIDPVYHKGLLNYIAYKAYMKNDADTYNNNKAADFLRLFEDEFGPRHSATYENVAHNTPMYSTITSAGMC